MPRKPSHKLYTMKQFASLFFNLSDELFDRFKDFMIPGRVSCISWESYPEWYWWSLVAKGFDLEFMENEGYFTGVGIEKLKKNVMKEITPVV